MKTSSRDKKLDKELNKSQYFGTGKSLESIFPIFIIALQIKLLLVSLYIYLQRVVWTGAIFSQLFSLNVSLAWVQLCQHPIILHKYCNIPAFLDYSGNSVTW